jgi:two-component system, cell cycle response regulator
LIDLKEDIRSNSVKFLPRHLVKLINSSSNKMTDEEDITEFLNSAPEFEEPLLDYINKTSLRGINSISDALNSFGSEYCLFSLINLVIERISGEKVKENIADLIEMQFFMASASYNIAKKCKISNANLAYISGILSNISYFYLNRFHENEYRNLNVSEKNAIKRMNYEWETFGIDHAEISYFILGNAGVSQDIFIPVRYHHQKNIQQNIGTDAIKDLSLCAYFASLLTNMFYEDLGIATDFRKDMRNMTGMLSNELDELISDTIELFKRNCTAAGLKKLKFPGYFKLISWFDTKIAMLQSEIEITAKKNMELNLQNSKYQKALEDSNKKLVGIALTDPLTGAFNRRYLDEKLHDEFLKAKRYNQSFILISCDIDHFKVINDTYGHAFGDVVLIKIVQIIKSSIRKTDYIARTGGEEFIIVCHSSNQLGGIIIAEKIRKTIETSAFVFENKNVPVTMSFGVANYFPEVKSADELIRISDDRLYAAKNSGRNKVVYK